MRHVMKISVKLNTKLSVKPTMKMYAELFRIQSVTLFKKLNANRKIYAFYFIKESGQIRSEAVYKLSRSS